MNFSLQQPTILNFAIMNQVSTNRRLTNTVDKSWLLYWLILQQTRTKIKIALKLSVTHITLRDFITLQIHTVRQRKFMNVISTLKITLRVRFLLSTIETNHMSFFTVVAG